MRSVKVINVWQCSPDAGEAFEQELKRLIDTSVNEDGCLSYEIYQPKNRPDEYVMIEEWQTEDALKHHQNSSHYKHFVRIAPVFQKRPPESKQLVRLV